MPICNKCKIEGNTNYCGNCGSIMVPIIAKPEPVLNPDFSTLISYCKQHIDSPNMEDNPYYIYEVAMIAIYGKDVFKYLNSIG